MSNHSVEIHGFCDERFSGVKDAFAANFVEGMEVGASVAVTLGGNYMVDLWAGHMDAERTKPWEENTIVNVYSTTKIMTALCALMLVDRGELEIDTPVADYWPEFAQAGKETLPVRYLFSHSAGLSGFDTHFTAADLYNWDKAVQALAAQKPWWEPGTVSGYHSVTFGHLLGELVRRISGKSLGQFFRTEVADIIGADFHIGLAEEHAARVATLVPPEEMPAPPGDIDPNSVAARTFLSTGISIEDTATRAWQAAEIPASNGHGNARSVARVGSLLALGGELDGHRLLSQETVEKAIEEQIYGTDLVLGSPTRFGLGFGLASKETPYPNPRTFYWGGYGGSSCVMDLDAGLCYTYAMNQIVQSLTGDPRTMRIKDAVLSSVANGGL